MCESRLGGDKPDYIEIITALQTGSDNVTLLWVLEQMPWSQEPGTFRTLTGSGEPQVHFPTRGWLFFCQVQPALGSTVLAERLSPCQEGPAPWTRGRCPCSCMSLCWAMALPVKAYPQVGNLPSKGCSGTTGWHTGQEMALQLSWIQSNDLNSAASVQPFSDPSHTVPPVSSERTHYRKRKF